MINQLKELFGPRCTGIKMNGESENFLNQPNKKMKFCEAVNHSFKVPLRIVNDNMVCPGARRALGFERDNGDLVAKIAEHTEVPVSYIRKTMQEVPVVPVHIDHLIMGVTAEMEKEITPDVYIVLTKPARIMQLIQILARQEAKPHFLPFCLHSICGSIFSKSYVENDILVSFGCPDSRRYGGVRDDEVVVGIPSTKVDRVLEGMH